MDASSSVIDMAPVFPYCHLVISVWPMRSSGEEHDASAMRRHSAIVTIFIMVFHFHSRFKLTRIWTKRIFLCASPTLKGLNQSAQGEALCQEIHRNIP